MQKKMNLLNSYFAIIKSKKIKRLVHHLYIGYYISILLTSCISIKPPTPPVEYFQSEESAYPISIETIAPQIAKIEKDDVLGIVVSSSNKESNDILNFYNVSSLPQATFTPGGDAAGSQPLGYTVDSLGAISMPIIGKQTVGGLTLQQAEEKLRSVIEKTLKNPAVNIRYMNHKFTILGEVGRAGTFNLSNDRTNIIEALGAAGDISIYGKRDGIKIIRVVNKKREIGLLNIASKDVFMSPYYYIKNNDIIYIPPVPAKTIPEPVSAPSLFTQRAPIYLGLVSALVSLFVLVTRL